jgi:hypothetical protein
MATYAVQTWTDEVTWANAADMQHMEAGIALINTQGLPAGGTAGQVLAKSSGTDYAVAWKAVLGSEVVETANIKNLNVTTGKIAVGAVTEEKLTIGAEGKLIPTAGFKTGYILTAGATAAEWKANTGGTGITAAEAEVIASNIAQRENVSARVVLTAKVTLKGIPASAETDGVTLLEGDIVLASKQTGTEAENGLWEVKKGTTAWARPASYATGALKHGIFVPILQGTTHGGSTWVQTNTTFIKVDTEASSWAENSAGTGVIGNPQEFNKEEAKTGVSGATNLDLSKASVFRIELTGAAVFTLTNLPTTYPMEITLLIKQDATGGRTWSFANAAPALEWIGPEPTFETAAGSRAVMQLAVLSKGTEILGWAKAGGSVPAIKAPPPTGMIVGVNWMQDAGYVLHRWCPLRTHQPAPRQPQQSSGGGLHQQLLHHRRLDKRGIKPEPRADVGSPEQSGVAHQSRG